MHTLSQLWDYIFKKNPIHCLIVHGECTCTQGRAFDNCIYNTWSLYTSMGWWWHSIIYPGHKKSWNWERERERERERRERFKVALYTKSSTIYEPTSQYGDLNILWNCLYRSTFLYIIIAQWSRALVLWTAHPEFKSAGDFC